MDILYLNCFNFMVHIRYYNYKGVFTVTSKFKITCQFVHY